MSTFFPTAPLYLRLPPRTFPCPNSPPPLLQHFHYSYLLHSAAALAHLRPEWATADNKNWVDTLIRDVNDPNKVGNGSKPDWNEMLWINVQHSVPLEGCYVFISAVLRFGQTWASSTRFRVLFASVGVSYPCLPHQTPELRRRENGSFYPIHNRQQPLAIKRSHMELTSV